MMTWLKYSRDSNTYMYIFRCKKWDVISSKTITLKMRRVGHSKSATTDNWVEANNCMVNLNGRHATVQHIADIMDISVDSIHAALVDIL